MGLLSSIPAVYNKSNFLTILRDTIAIVLIIWSRMKVLTVLLLNFIVSFLFGGI